MVAFQVGGNYLTFGTLGKTVTDGAEQACGPPGQFTVPISFLTRGVNNARIPAEISSPAATPP